MPPIRLQWDQNLSENAYFTIIIASFWIFNIEEYNFDSILELISPHWQIIAAFTGCKNRKISKAMFIYAKKFKPSEFHQRRFIIFLKILDIKR